jgi:MFS family permease
MAFSTDIANVRKKLGNVFYGWWMVAAGVVLCIFGYGGWFYSFGALFNPIRTEFGWSRAMTSIPFSLSRLEGGIEGLVTGPLTDRFGPRFMVRVGFTMAALGFLLMSRINSFWMFIISYSLLLSLGMNAGLYMPLQTAVVKWFSEKRGLALGALTTGAALGGSILVPIVAWLITGYGWRTAVLVLAIAAAVLGWTVSFILKPHPPEHYGLRMDGRKDEAVDTAAGEKKDTVVPEFGLYAREAARTRNFWIIVISFLFAHTALSAIVVHEIPFIEDMGISPVLAATALGTMTLMSAPGRFFGGWLADKWSVKYLYVISSVGQAIGLLILSRVTSMSWVWVFVVIYGFSYGSRIPLEAAMRGEYFGRKAYGTIYGYINSIAVLGSFGGPYLAGWLFDNTGSYVSSFLIFAGMMIVAVIAILFLKSPIDHQLQMNK